ncbi:phosphatase PAP2 family protein [Rhodoplanes sp. Z2-YC6860]|uniref:phosphatase PAP2 family protein n=1 Tax=Rhodoplanes sp. Z2-YC6860 TaxID=674703 RepID=UPI0012EE2659|nr:phosphatase PAP2 family protein [Rhodoplanes sp. Z2-YC6860]
MHSVDAEFPAAPVVVSKDGEAYAIWIIIAMIAAVDAVWLRRLGFGVVKLQNPMVFFIGLFSCLYLFYAFVRPNHQIAAVQQSLAQVLSFSVVLGLFSYLTVTLRFPLIDRYLAHADAAVGVNWLSWFFWISGHPYLNFTLAVAYCSPMLVLFVLVVALPVFVGIERVRELIWVYVVTALIVTAISSIAPAESAWIYFGVPDRVLDVNHLAHFAALRSGRMTEIPIAEMTGLVTFPSFHAAVGLILIYAARGVRYLFPLSFAINGLMILSTPSIGGHYFVDVAAGLAVVLFVIIGLRLAEFPRSP